MFLNSFVISEYLDSSIGLSLTTSFPDSSGNVQYSPLTLCPFIESASPGILLIGIAAKFVIPYVLNFFCLRILSSSALNFLISNVMSGTL